MFTPGKIQRKGSNGLNFAMQGDSNIDPLRFSTKTTWAAMDKAVIQNSTPSHLPKPCWAGMEKEIESECEKKGIPQPMGKRFNWKLPSKYNKASW